MGWISFLQRCIPPDVSGLGDGRVFSPSADRAPTWGGGLGIAWGMGCAIWVAPAAVDPGGTWPSAPRTHAGSPCSQQSHPRISCRWQSEPRARQRPLRRGGKGMTDGQPLGHGFCPPLRGSGGLASPASNARWCHGF